jgi:putative FmdB family regulatory protein
VPIYDYVCARCDAVTEVIHGIHAPSPRFCPACGAEGTLRKGITTSAVHFKGSGWAKKDRASSAASSKTRAAKPAGEGGTSGGETGTPGGESTGDSTKKSDAASSTAPGPAAAAGVAATDGGD